DLGLAALRRTLGLGIVPRAGLSGLDGVDHDPPVTACLAIRGEKLVAQCDVDRFVAGVDDRSIDRAGIARRDLNSHEGQQRPTLYGVDDVAAFAFDIGERNALYARVAQDSFTF